MTRKLILEMLERLCLEFRNMLLGRGIEVETRVIACIYNIDALHILVLDVDGNEIVEFHIWSPGDDNAENQYRTTFQYMLQGVHFAMAFADFVEEMRKHEKDFD